MLTDTTVRTAKPRDELYRMADSGGLCLEVTPAGSKLWRFRFRLGGRASMTALGAYPATSLKEAREARDAAKALVALGKNPATERKAEVQAMIVRNAGTFEAISEEWFSRKKGKWSERYIQQVRTLLEKDAYPKIGALPIADVKVPHVRAVLKAIEARDAKTSAILMRQVVYAICNDAIAHGLSELNPAASLKGIIERDTVRHSTALEKDEFSILLKKIDGYSRPVTRIALLLLAHCFVRSAELRKAEWKEIDFDKSQWTIPAEHMKKRRLHIVPLTRQTTALLKELQGMTGHTPYLFPNTWSHGETVMSAMTLTRALQYLGYGGKFGSHGFRSTASTHLNEGVFNGSDGRPVTFRIDTIEAQLAHQEKNATRAAYNRAEYIAERRVMMNVWSDFIDSLLVSGNVIPLVGQKRK